MKDSRDWMIFKEDHIECKICGEKVPFGIISVSGHWAKCQGKDTMDFVNKVAESSLISEDKIDLVKNEFNITQ